MADSASAFTALRISFDALKELVKVLKKPEIDAHITEVQSALLTAQQMTLELQSKATLHYKVEATLQKRCFELENKLSETEDWAKKAACYSMILPQPGTHIYVMEFDAQKGASNGLNEPSHWACAHCFQQRKRSILTQKTSTTRYLHCPTCDVQVESRPAPRQPSHAHMQPSYRLPNN